LPVAIPFLLLENVRLALRLSNGIALAMLFLAGYAYGNCIDRSPWLTGLAMVALGTALVGLTMALGG
jgi:VIT1/CCC1 family predicted Fe2+/Mn2+ transporter